MTIWDVPPRIKVLEALSAIAGDRVERKGRNKARVISSMGDREYKVVYDLGKEAIFSNDNGSKYRGYLGYPSIALLMLRGKLPFEEDIAEGLKGIKWKKLNKRYGSYDRVIKFVEKKLKKEGIQKAEVEEFLDETIEEIRELEPKKLKLDEQQGGLEKFR